jgi:hypothetical protein
MTLEGIRKRMLADEEMPDESFKSISGIIALEAHEDRLQLWEAVQSRDARIAQLEAELSGSKIDFLQRWMRTPNPMLGNAVPIEMMRQGLGTRVAMFIDAAYEASSAPETKGDANV